MERTLAEILSHAPVFIRRPEGQIVYWSIGCEELYGFGAQEAAGQRSHELLKTVFPGGLDQAEGALARTGEWRGRLRHTAKDGRHVWTESLWRLRQAQHPAGWLVVEQNTDITERVEVERERELLTLELDHRVKNTLATVQGIARLTFGQTDRPLLQAFDERLSALSDAHNILGRERWSHAGLKAIIAAVLKSLHLEDRVDVRGEDVRLAPNAAVAYALAFHELAVNAVRHGALSTPHGRVEIAWRAEGPDGQNVHLTWTERGGPTVGPPKREGFGARLIRRAVASELNTPVDLRYDPEGFVCEFKGRPGASAAGPISSATVLEARA